MQLLLCPGTGTLLKPDYLTITFNGTRWSAGFIAFFWLAKSRRLGLSISLFISKYF